MSLQVLCLFFNKLVCFFILNFVSYLYILDACMLVKSFQSCPTFYDPMNTGVLEWVAMPSSRGSSRSESESCSVMSYSLWPHELYSPWNSLGQNTGVGSLALLQGIFPTQELNPGLPHCRQILYQLSYQRSPHPGLKPTSLTSLPHWQTGSLPLVLPGKLTFVLTSY